MLTLVVKGLNNRQIGEQLHLATGTVCNHVSVIMEKLAVSDRTQAALMVTKFLFNRPTSRFSSTTTIGSSEFEAGTITVDTMVAGA